jgi:hypothetical protein
MSPLLFMAACLPLAGRWFHYTLFETACPPLRLKREGGTGK